MPAQSKSQQRLFGLVRAVQKGDTEAPSDKIAKMAQDVSSSDVEDFASTSHENLPDKKIQRESMFGKVVSQYNEYGSTLRQSFSMREMAERLMEIADFAEQTLTTETAGNDWFDTHTIRRNVKEMRSYVKEFSKLAEDYDTIRSRATALYDDMGRVLERYFEVSGYDTDDDGVEDLSPGNAPKDPVDPDHASQMAHEENDNYRQTMRERLLSMARTRLTGEQLVKFDTLPEEKQVKVAWKVVK